MARIFVTGDKHGCYYDLSYKLAKAQATTDDIVIILGDHGTLYYGTPTDDNRKKKFSLENATFIMIRGNHDRRPTDPPYQYKSSHINTPSFEGEFYCDPMQPNVLYTKEYGWYRFGSKRVFVIGGAYSVDKQRRLQMRAMGFTSYHWFDNEQLSEAERQAAEQELLNGAQGEFYIMSHTCPIKFKPFDKLMRNVDQSTVDETMEKWLDSVDDQIKCVKWYCGHWHIERDQEHMRFMYEDLEIFDEIKEN